MKNYFTILLTLIITTSTCFADIQEPINEKYNKTRNFSRSLANILYGWTEIPYTIINRYDNKTESSSAVLVGGFVRGVKRAGHRYATGFKEIFRIPIHSRTCNSDTNCSHSYSSSYKHSCRLSHTCKKCDIYYRSRLKDSNHHPRYGYEEFPPQVGFDSIRPFVKGRAR